MAPTTTAPNVHQRAVEVLLEIAVTPRVADLGIAPSMPRHAVPELFQEAIEAADPRYQAETALFELAMVLERPDARWERLSAEQSAFYNDLCFDFDESGQLRVKYDPQVVA